MEEKIIAVKKMQDYINLHLYEEINICDLARSVCYSPWHARRIFIELTGVSPTDYVRKLRLKNAALKLRDEKVKVIDVAFECGFNSVDGFQRAFYKEYGCNPKEYALNPVPIPLFISYGVDTIYQEEKEYMETKQVFITIVEKPERKVIIKRGRTATDYWSYCMEVGCDVWGILTSIKSISNEPICMWLPQKLIKEGTGEYVQGVEVALNYNGEVPAGFEEIILPAAKYIMFQGEPFEEEDFEQAIKEIWDAEKKYDPSSLGLRFDPDNPRIQLEPIGKRGYIELLPVK